MKPIFMRGTERRGQSDDDDLENGNCDGGVSWHSRRGGDATASADGTERTDVVDAHHMREIYTFDSIGQMVAASDAVVVGVVREGRVVEEDADVGGGLSFTEVVVDVDRVLAGIDSKALTLEIDEISAGDNREWLTPGATVMLGLTQIADEPPLYRPTNTQSVFVFVGDRVVPGLNRDEFTNQAAAVDRAGILARG